MSVWMGTQKSIPHCGSYSRLLKVSKSKLWLTQAIDLKLVECIDVHLFLEMMAKSVAMRNTNCFGKRNHKIIEWLGCKGHLPLNQAFQRDPIT